MTLSAADSLLLESMKQRELTLKRRQRAASAIYVEARRYRLLLVVANAVFVGAVFFLLLLCSFWLIGGEGGRGWLSALVGAAVAGLLAWIVGPSVVGYSDSAGCCCDVRTSNSTSSTAVTCTPVRGGRSSTIAAKRSRPTSARSCT